MTEILFSVFAWRFLQQEVHFFGSWYLNCFSLSWTVLYHIIHYVFLVFFWGFIRFSLCDRLQVCACMCDQQTESLSEANLNYCWTHQSNFGADLWPCAGGPLWCTIFERPRKPFSRDLTPATAVTTGVMFLGHPILWTWWFFEQLLRKLIAVTNQNTGYKVVAFRYSLLVCCLYSLTQPTHVEWIVM